MSKKSDKARRDASPDLPIAARGVVKDYHDGERTLRVLNGVDLELKPREAVAIMGPSGSGKSTFLNLLGALDRPTEGAIRIHGDDVAALGASALNRLRRERIGFVFQFHHLLPELRAWENVAMPALIARRSRADAREQAMQLLETVGLADRATHLPAALSGGEQQRVALARALVNDPPIILADEPTGNLDERMGRQVIELLWQTARSRNRSLVIVTHEKFIADQADRVLHLHLGKLSS